MECGRGPGGEWVGMVGGPCSVWSRLKLESGCVVCGGCCACGVGVWVGVWVGDGP
jgi:hypothetical protein